MQGEIIYCWSMRGVGNVSARLIQITNDHAPFNYRQFESPTPVN